MIQSLVQRLAAVAWLVAALAALAVTLRFCALALGEAHARWRSQIPSAGAPRSSAPPAPTRRPRSLEERMEEIKALARSEEPDEDAGGPTVLNAPIMVDVGPSRSEVYVNGTRRGHTPFIGEVSCVPGSAVRVEVVPPAGLPKKGSLECQPGILRFEAH